MTSTTRPRATLTPADVLSAAYTVITARGWYQSASRPSGHRTPTVFEVRALLNRPADPARQADPLIIDTIRQWAARGGDGRADLARAVRAPRATEWDLPLLCWGVHAWQQDQHRAHRAAQATADAARSRHQGIPGERITRRVTVGVVVRQADRQYGPTVQDRYLIKLRDGSGHLYVWAARPRPRPLTELPAPGAEITITGTVQAHHTYRDTAQTYLTRCQWAPAR
ncbi:hypothetical protein ACWC9H_27285 [Streptomyces sp. NPDC001251]